MVGYVMLKRTVALMAAAGVCFGLTVCIQNADTANMVLSEQSTVSREGDGSVAEPKSHGSAAVQQRCA